MVTFCGLPIAALSGYWFAQGHWGAYVLGALLYFAPALVDEIDGILARNTFRESAFGCWLESFVYYATYVLYSGEDVGSEPAVWKPMDGIGPPFAVRNRDDLLVAIRHPKVPATPDRPEQYLPRDCRALEGDSGNIISKFVRLRRGTRYYHSFEAKMKISKYIHSCILVESKKERLLIDPGPFTFIEGEVKVGDFKGLTTILFTLNLFLICAS